MDVSPEEKQRIYTEEKAQIESEEKINEKGPASEDISSTNLDPKVGGLLCYLGIWITGIIFLILERKNIYIRFHAIQSIIVFGVLSIAFLILSRIPMIGVLFSLFVGIVIFILWIVLMAKTYQGELLIIPIAGDVAQYSAYGSADKTSEFKDRANKHNLKPQTTIEQTATPTVDFDDKRTHDRTNEFLTRTKDYRITSSSFAIAWSFVIIIFFNYFYEYIAYYQFENNDWVRYPILTAEFSGWLLILTVAQAFIIVGHIILIIYDKYTLRETTLIILRLLNIAVVLSLLTIYPFDLTTVPNNIAIMLLPIVINMLLIGLIIGYVIATIVSFIKLIVNMAKGTTGY